MSAGERHPRIRNMRERKLGIVIVFVFLTFLGLILWNWIETCYQRRQLFDLYFPVTVQGLSVGANVLCDGRKIGQVESIRLRSLSPDISVQNYAIVTIYADVRKLWQLPGNIDETAYREAVGKQIRYGLRGRLLLPSLISGGLCVELFYDRQKPAFFADDPLCENIEIPTYSSSLSQYIDQINARIEEYKLKELSEKLLAAENYIRRLNTHLTQNDFKKLNQNVITKTESLRDVFASGKLAEKLTTLNTSLENFAQALESGDQNIEFLFERSQDKLAAFLTQLEALKLRLQATRNFDSLQLEEIGTQLNHYSNTLRRYNALLQKYLREKSDNSGQR